ncbi:MAG: efflux transporter outer membrane subunit [Polyangia bacterium]
MARGVSPVRSRGIAGAGVILLALGGACAVGPNYQRPPIDTPGGFRGKTATSTGSLADLPWWKLFRDENLQGLIRTALAGNYDLRIAVSRVEQAREFAAQARAGFFPQVDYGAVAARGKNVTALSLPAPTGTVGSIFAADFSVSWEIDLWGRIRRLTESAQAQFLATEEARRGVTISVIAEVAQDYLQLLALERERRIAEETRDAFAGSLQIFNERLEGGVASKLETASAEALLDAAAATIPNIERQLLLQENLLSVLLGRNPGPISRSGSGFDEQLLPEIPVGLPSALLERRPDIRQAEQQLRSANAQIGVAEADCLPQLSLTGLLGHVSAQLANLLSGGALAWSAAASLTGPIFHGGQLRARYRQAKAARDEAVLQYQATVLRALQEVADGLLSRQKLAEERVQQTHAVAAYREAVKISLERYRHGNASYYEVLQAQQQLFPAQITLVQTQLNELLALVQLYRALGGGWSE